MKGADILIEAIPCNILQVIIGVDWDRVKRVLDIIPAGISVATDASCKEIIHNAAAAEFMRIKPWENFVYKSDQSQPVRMLNNNKELTPAELPLHRSAIKGVEVRGFEVEFIWDDGVRKIMLMNSSPVVDENGTIIGAIGSFKDITGRKRAEEALQVSERKYHALFNSIDEGFCIIEVLFDDNDRPLDYRFLEVNQAFERQTGLVDALGRRMRDMAPEHEQHWFDIYGRIALTGEPARFQEPAKALGRYYDVYAFRVGKPGQRHVAILFNDINARKQAEGALRQSEERFRALVDASSDVVYRMSPDGGQMYYLQGRDFIPDTCSPNHTWLDKYICSDDQPRMLAAIGEAIRARRVFELEHRVLRVDGTPGWAFSRAVPILDANGEIIEWFGTAKDITKRKQAKEALRESEERHSFLLKLGDALRPLTDAKAIQGAATSLLAEHLRAAQAGYGGYTADAIVVHSETLNDTGQPPNAAGTYKISHFPASVALLRTGKDLVVTDVLSFPAFSEEERAHLAALNVRAVIAVPLVKEGRLIAALNVRQATPRRWTKAEAELVREVADRTWAAVQRAQAEAKLRRTLDHLEEKVAERTRELTQGRQRLLDVLETLPVHIFLINPDYKVLFANRAARKMFGKPDGRCCYDYLHGRHKLCGHCQSYRPLEAGEPHNWEAKTHGGHILDVYNLPFTDADGSHLILKMSIDITERKNATRALRQSEERFARIFYHSPVLLAIIRMRDNVFIDVNQKFIDTMEYSREEVLGKTPVDLNIWAGDNYQIEFFLSELQEKGVVTNFEYRLKTKSGKIIAVLVSTVKMDLNGEACRISLMKDITNEKKLEAEITRLDRLNLVGEMAAGIGHEVRNPMTTVRGFLQLLGGKERYAQDRVYFNLMVEELDRANSIISEYLSLAKNKAVNLEMKDLNKILRSLLPLMRADGLVTDNYIVLKTKKVPGLMLDEKEIRQLILNLVRNGLQAMEPDKTLTIKTFQEEDNVVLAVKDQGMGIPYDIIDRIGNPFFTTKDNGTGLGLAVCFSIAARHKAIIDFETGEQGTTFFVRFKKMAPAGDRKE